MDRYPGWEAKDYAELAWKKRFKPRDRVISLVQRGRLTPSQAEAWAAKNNEPPFEVKSRADLFDPTRKRDWTMAMMMAWVTERSIDAVRDASPEFRAEWWHWGPKRKAQWPVPSRNGWWVTSGHDFMQAKPLTASDVLDRMTLDGPGPNPNRPPRCEIEQEVRNALRNENVKALGASRRGGMPAEIPAIAWASLSPFTSSARKDKTEHHAVYDGDGEAVYWHVTVDSKDVRAVWLASETPSNAAAEAIAPIQPPGKRGPGRPKGSGGYAKTDAPLVEEGTRRIAAGEPTTAVISDLAERAKGGPDHQSKIDRLRRRFV